MRMISWVLRVGASLLVRPRLWRTALSQTSRLAAPRWWMRFPFLPLPTPEYMEFRTHTMYGSASGGATRSLPAAADVVAYLDWVRRYPAG